MFLSHARELWLAQPARRSFFFRGGQRITQPSPSIILISGIRARKGRAYPSTRRDAPTYCRPTAAGIDDPAAGIDEPAVGIDASIAAVGEPTAGIDASTAVIGEPTVATDVSTAVIDATCCYRFLPTAVIGLPYRISPMNLQNPSMYCYR